MIDFQITEAVAIKAMQEDEKAAKKAKTKQWRKDTEGLNKLKEIAGG